MYDITMNNQTQKTGDLKTDTSVRVKTKPETEPAVLGASEDSILG